MASRPGEFRGRNHPRLVKSGDRRDSRGPAWRSALVIDDDPRSACVAEQRHRVLAAIEDRIDLLSRDGIVLRPQRVTNHDAVVAPCRGPRTDVRWRKHDVVTADAREPLDCVRIAVSEKGGCAGVQQRGDILAVVVGNAYGARDEARGESEPVGSSDA
jgi:hypothetical protein